MTLAPDIVNRGLNPHNLEDESNSGLDGAYAVLFPVIMIGVVHDGTPTPIRNRSVSQPKSRR